MIRLWRKGEPCAALGGGGRVSPPSSPAPAAHGRWPALSCGRLARARRSRVRASTGRASTGRASTGRASTGRASTGVGEHGAGEREGVQPLEFELQKQQLEIDTRPCRSLDELSRELRRCRATAAAAAARAGVAVAALGTSPLAVHPEVVPTSRYQAMAAVFGLTAQEQLTCGCHVHVGIRSAEEGVAVLDRIQPWLATLLALSANSPFWQGVDSAYGKLPLPGVGPLALLVARPASSGRQRRTRPRCSR